MIPAARAINPNFAIASEIWFDRALPYVDVSYMRMGTVDMDSTAFRYTFPEWTATIFGESPGDINPMNNGMRYGLVWDLAPRHYNDSADEPLTQPLAKYVSELIRIRKQYEDLLFFGRFNDMLGATVQGGPDIRYSVFKSMDSNNKDVASVIVNFGDTPETAKVGIDGASGKSSSRRRICLIATPLCRCGFPFHRTNSRWSSNERPTTSAHLRRSIWGAAHSSTSIDRLGMLRLFGIRSDFVLGTPSHVEHPQASFHHGMDSASYRARYRSACWVQSADIGHADAKTGGDSSPEWPQALRRRAGPSILVSHSLDGKPAHALRSQEPSPLAQT